MSESTKRLFTAFPVEAPESLVATVKKLRINAQQKEMEFNWSPVSNYHVTLNFLGTTDVARLPELEDLLFALAHDASPFTTSLRGLGAFPDDRHMRVLWTGVRKSRALSELQEKLRAGLVDAGFPLEKREYTPHLTLGRLRKARSGGDLISPFVRASFGDLDIRAIHLYESVMHGAHPVYQILKSFPLEGEEPQL